MASTETQVIGVTIPAAWLPLLDRKRGGKLRATFVRDLLETAIKGKRKMSAARKPGRPRIETKGG